MFPPLCCKLSLDGRVGSSFVLVREACKNLVKILLENGKLRRLSNEQEVHEKVCQRFLALVLTRLHDKIIQGKSLEYKQWGREGTYFTVHKYHPTGEIEIQHCQVLINKLKSRDRTSGNRKLVRW